MYEKSPKQRVNAEIYDQASAEAGWDSPERAQALVSDYIGNGSVVLDIGIGTGQAVQGYAEKGARVIGLDHDFESLAHAQRVTGASGEMRVADINKKLPLEDCSEKIDVAQAIGVWEFARDLEGFVGQVRDALKPTGVFVFTLERIDTDNENKEEYFPENNVTVYRHGREEVEDLLKKNGLSVLFSEEYDGYSRGDMKAPYVIFLAQKNQRV